MRSEVADVTGIVKYIRKSFFRLKTGGGGSALPNFFFEGATDTPAPLLLRLCLSQTEVKYMNVMNPFSRDKEFEI